MSGLVKVCPTCNGSGTNRYGGTCNKCQGSGSVPAECGDQPWSCPTLLRTTKTAPATLP